MAGPIMTWGKYKGKEVKEVILTDRRYAIWVFQQEFVKKKFKDIYDELYKEFHYLIPIIK